VSNSIKTQEIGISLAMKCVGIDRSYRPNNRNSTQNIGGIFERSIAEWRKKRDSLNF
jgi:hypothetical protein